MKKLLVITVILFLSFILVGCDNDNGGSSSPLIGTKSFTCTKTDIDDDGSKTDEVIKVDYKNTKIKTITSDSTVTMNADYIDMIISMTDSYVEKFNELDGMKYSVEKASDTSVKYHVEIDYEKIDLKQMEEMFEDVDDAISEYDKNDTADEYKKELQEDGYVCK